MIVCYALTMLITTVLLGESVLDYVEARSTLTLNRVVILAVLWFCVLTAIFLST